MVGECQHLRRVAVRAWVGDREHAEGEICADCSAERVRHVDGFWRWTHRRTPFLDGSHLEVLGPVSTWPTRRARGYLLRLAAVEAENGREREAGRLADAALMLPGGGSEDATRRVLATLGWWDEGQVEEVVRRLARGGA